MYTIKIGLFLVVFNVGLFYQETVDICSWIGGIGTCIISYAIPNIIFIKYSKNN